MQQFMNAPDDVQWLKETALKGVQALPEFQSFILYGNEDAPDRIDLYRSIDPSVKDSYWQVTFPHCPPVYCEIHCVEGQ